MPDLSIKYANEGVVCFIIEGETFYLKRHPGLPRLYDERGTVMFLANIDSWLEVRTQQRHSYRSLCDMADAFLAGLKSSYNKNDIDNMFNNCVLTTIKEITRKSWLYEYSLLFWIEVLGDDKIGQYLSSLRENFDTIAKKIGPKALSNDLTRILRTCIYRHSRNADICDKLLSRLGPSVSDPTYPDTTKIDSEVLMSTRESVGKSLSYFYKDIPNEVVEMADAIQGGRL
jgi:hypothetical protein